MLPPGQTGERIKACPPRREFVYHSFQTVPAGYYPKGAPFSIFEVAEKEGMTKGQALQKAELIEFHKNLLPFN